MARFLDTSDSRGIAEHRWLHSRHTFSFASYNNLERMGFGLLRVINDDIVEPAMGFGTHPHENMEIISIPLSGSLKHEDSMGNQHVISAGEVQVMSAGTGVTHSEYNNSDSESVNFLQIWVMPKITGIPPRYDQRKINTKNICNIFHPIIAPLETDGVVNINQDAYFSIANIDRDMTIEYKKTNKNSGVYFFLITGSINIGDTALSKRDGVGITEEDNFKIHAQEDSRVLCMEVPMK
jgi:redox-sensitive bicupin YhaK (pirin superfamily)